jgi:hypothetical protein
MAMEDISMEDMLAAAGEGAPMEGGEEDPKAAAFSQLDMMDKQMIIDYLKESAILPPEFELPEMPEEAGMEEGMDEEAAMPPANTMGPV